MGINREVGRPRDEGKREMATVSANTDAAVVSLMTGRRIAPVRDFDVVVEMLGMVAGCL